MEEIKVIVVEPERESYVAQISNTLEMLQQVVGGRIEVSYPYRDMAAIVCNEEGKLNGLELNRILRDEAGEPYDIIAGTFMVVGLTEDDFGTLTPKQLEIYQQRFQTPQLIHVTRNGIFAMDLDQENRFQYYQLKDAYRENGNSADHAYPVECYEKVYDWNLNLQESPQMILEMIRQNPPYNYEGRMPEQGDVLLTQLNGKSRAYQVDKTGLHEIDSSAWKLVSERKQSITQRLQDGIKQKHRSANLSQDKQQEER